MNDEYLWDGSGPRDLEVARLERTLAPLRFRGRVPRPGRTRWLLAAALLAAAALLLTVTPSAPDSPWQVEGATLRPGQSVHAAESSVRLEAQQIGRVDLAPHSILRAAGGKGLALQRGELHAFIWAPAREFVVETPSARAVDLGCEYTLSVDERGDGVLRVTMGWVAFQVGHREAFIPAGARCITRKQGGPGLPFFEDAPEPLQRAVANFEQGDDSALPALLAAARPRDAVTLWHLLTSVPDADRGRVFDRLRELVPLPAEVLRTGALQADPHTIDQCWNALGLENTGWWRGWERKWGE
jgi:hypothetical protein